MNSFMRAYIFLICLITFSATTFVSAGSTSPEVDDVKSSIEKLQIRKKAVLERKNKEQIGSLIDWNKLEVTKENFKELMLLKGFGESKAFKDFIAKCNLEERLHYFDLVLTKLEERNGIKPSS